MCSKILEHTDLSEIGFSAKSLGPFLWSGKILASLQSTGTMPVDSDWLTDLPSLPHLAGDSRILEPSPTHPPRH